MSESVGVYVTNGSMRAVFGSGTINMSEALIACQPRIDEPSKPRPSSKTDSLIWSIGNVQCCQVPSRSMNLMSTICTRFSLANPSTSRGFMRFGCLLPREPVALRFACEKGQDDATRWTLRGRLLEGFRTKAPIFAAEVEHDPHAE